MTSHRDHFEACLGKDIRDLIPLISEALVALDKPGTRALRRKIDKAFHSVVWGYGTIRRLAMDESEWDALRPTLPRYERVTPVWPGKAAYRAQKLLEARPLVPCVTAAEYREDRAADDPCRGLRLIVDNSLSRSRRLTAGLPHGGAA